MTYLFLVFNIFCLFVPVIFVHTFRHELQRWTWRSTVIVLWAIALEAVCVIDLCRYIAHIKSL
jgi:hypothetical protein